MLKAASNYQIKLKVTFKITNDNLSKEIIFEEKQKMEKISDYFDEKTMKQIKIILDYLL